MADTTLCEGELGRGSAPQAKAAGGLRRGTTLARYIVIDRLGGGGMGDVYSAWDEELRRRVALKVIRPREGTDARERMLAEARALASLRHPHVVAVHDAGEVLADADAAPVVYVAMEHLEGATGTTWIETDAPYADRIRVVLQCAEGLAAAHAQGLVHRDIKPSNVVIETRDSGPWAMLVDFGLAASEAETATVAGGTRAYMAPECHDGNAANPRADQWSLALMAVECLSAQRPTQADALAGRLGPCGAATAPLRRALQRDPADRFETVAAFALALRRTMGQRTRRGWAVASLAVVALGTGAFALSAPETPSCIEQAAAAWADNAPAAQVEDALVELRQHAPQVGASVTTLTETWETRWTAQSRDACEIDDPATRERTEACLGHEATQMMALLRVGAEHISPQGRWQVLGALARAVQANPCVTSETGIGQTTPALARALALETASRLDEAFALAQEELGKHTEADAPVLRARVLQRLASIERRRGNLDASLELGERAMRWAAPSDDPRTWAHALIVRIETLLGLGEYDRALEAVRLARPAVAAAGDPPEILSYWHYSEGRALGSVSRFPEARAAHIQALDIRNQTDGNALHIADSHRAIGNISMRMDDCETALPHLREAVRLYQESLGEGSPTEAYALSSLAQCEAQGGDLETALATSRRASSRLEAVLGPESIELAKVLTMEGSILGGQGAYEASLSPFRRAANIRVKALGDTHPETLVAQTNLGWLLLTVGELDEAFALLSAMQHRLEQPDAPEHPNPGSFAGAMAALYDAQGHADKAVEFSARALELAESSPAASNPLTLTTPLYNLAELTEKAGDTERARGQYTRVWTLLDAHPAGAQQPTWAVTNLALGRLSNGAKANAYFDAALAANPALRDPIDALRHAK